MFMNILLIAICVGIIHFVLRIMTMILAPKDILFSSPKLGRIKARVRNGKIVGYIAHLKGLIGELPTAGGGTYTGLVHIDEETGKILAGPEEIRNFWWTFYGVRFIGLDSIYYYKTKKRTTDDKGKIMKEEEVTARSLHFSNVFPMSSKEMETKDGNRADLNYTYTLQTTHAGESLKYNDWLMVVEAPVKGTVKDYVSGSDIQELIAFKNELSTSSDSFVNCLKKLNNDVVGNVSLHRRVGQRIIAGSLTDVGFKDVMADALEAKKIAEEQGQAIIATAKATADAQVEEARGYKVLETTKNEMRTERAKSFAGPGGNLAASLEQSERMSKAISEHKGTLVLGQAMPTIPTE